MLQIVVPFQPIVAPGLLTKVLNNHRPNLNNHNNIMIIELVLFIILFKSDYIYRVGQDKGIKLIRLRISLLIFKFD